MLALLVIPAAFKIIEFIHNLNQTVNHLRTSLNESEQNINGLRQLVDDLKDQVAEQRQILQDHLAATADIQQQIIDQSINAIETTKQIEDVYGCLDLLDDRLLDLAKYERAAGKHKKQVRKEKRKAQNDKAQEMKKQKQEIEALDRKDPNEEIFDQFVADSLKSDPNGAIGFSDLQKIFKDWYKYYHEDELNDLPSNRELREYMCRNFNWDGHHYFWTGIRDQVQ